MKDIKPNQYSPYPKATANSPITFSILCIKVTAALMIMALGASYGIASYKLFSSLFSQLSMGVSGLTLVSCLAGIPLCIGLMVGFLVKRRKLAGFAVSGMMSVLTISLYVFAAGPCIS